MTTQAPEILVIDPGAMELPAMKLYGITVGNIDDPKSCTSYKFLTTGSNEKMTMCTALWRGYVSTYRLKADGSLTLEKLEYPFSESVQPDEVNEVLQGDFWLDLREWFMGDSMNIPFVKGKVVADRTQWKLKQGIPMRQAHRQLATNQQAVGQTMQAAMPNHSIEGTPNGAPHVKR